MSRARKYIIGSLVFTLPIAILFCLWANKTVGIYYSYSELHTSYKPNLIPSLAELGFNEIIHDVKNKLGLRTKSDVNIFIHPTDKRELDENLPTSGLEGKNALMVIDDEVFKGKARYRGDNYYHWNLPRKSWRFKTAKDDLYKMARKYNFIVIKDPGVMSNYMSFKLARKVGLVSPEGSIKTLSINNLYDGIKLMVEQVDEGFLRNNNIMPSDIYKGDLGGLTDFSMGLAVDLFSVASVWKKMSVNNHYPEENRIPLQTLFNQMKENNHELLDVRAFAKFMMFVDLTDTFHYDKTHNWLLYYDNYRERFFPIIWDTLGWSTYFSKNDKVNIIHTSQLLRNLYSDNRFVVAKYDELYDFYKNQEVSFLQMLDDEAVAVNNKLSIVGYPYINHKLKYATKQDVDGFVKIAKKRLARVKKAFLDSPSKSDYAYAALDHRIRLRVAGTKMINEIKLHLKEDVTTSKAMIHYKMNGESLKEQVRFYRTGNSREIVLPIKLLPMIVRVKEKNAPTLEPAHIIYASYKPATYDIVIEGLGSDNVEAVSLSTLALSKNSIDVAKFDCIEEVGFSSQTNVIPKYNERQTQAWSGKKVFLKDVTIEDDVSIEQGTRIIIGEGVSVRVLGKVIARGTPQQPIIFTAADSKKLWGAFVLKDERANSSVIKGCVFENGSGQKGDLFEYTAMLSIHNVKNVLIENTTFSNSKVTDDMVHVVYSDVIFRKCEFVNSFSDALDADISSIVVDSCTFSNSGNDAIDLMTAKAVVFNTKLLNSKDKGISIGEGSKLLAYDNLIEGNEIGLQSKDSSVGYVRNSKIVKNKLAVDAYKKNWRYSEGGRLVLENCQFENNIKVAKAGKRSHIIINNAQSKSPIAIGKNKEKKIVITSEKKLIPEFSDVFFSGYLNN